jgi:hypothetical protein
MQAIQEGPGVWGQDRPDLGIGDPAPVLGRLSPSPTMSAGALVKSLDWEFPDAGFITSLPTDPAILRKMPAVQSSDSRRECS